MSDDKGAVLQPKTNFITFVNDKKTGDQLNYSNNWVSSNDVGVSLEVGDEFLLTIDGEEYGVELDSIEKELKINNSEQSLIYTVTYHYLSN